MKATIREESQPEEQGDADDLRSQANLLMRVARHVSDANNGNYLEQKARELFRQAREIEERLPA